MTRKDIFSTLAILGTGVALAGCASIQADAAEVGGSRAPAHAEGNCASGSCGGKAKAASPKAEGSCGGAAHDALAAETAAAETPAQAPASPAQPVEDATAVDEQISADAAPAQAEPVNDRASEVTATTPAADNANAPQEVPAARPAPKKKAKKKKKKKASAGEAACGEGTCA